MLNFYFEITNLTQHQIKLISHPTSKQNATIIDNNQYKELTAVLQPNQPINLECEIQNNKGSYKFQFIYRIHQPDHRLICQYHYPLGYEAIIVSNIMHPQFQIEISCRPRLDH